MLQYRRLLILMGICGAAGCSREPPPAAPQEARSTTPIQQEPAPTNEGAVVVTKPEHRTTKPKALIVVDAAGNPIPQATIQGTSASMSGPTFFSDSNGQANIPFAIQPIQWVTVSKDGFKTADMINIDQPRPIRIMLEKGEGIVRPLSVMGSGKASVDASNN